MLEGVGAILRWAALTLESVVEPETQAVIINFSAVQESWKIIRDFVNMFFILFLIIMAFGTIFDIKKYTWRDMLVPFLIAALLINFSLVIGQYVAGVSNGLSSVLLKQIAGFSNDMANGFDIQRAIPGNEFAAQGLAMIAQGSAKVIFTGLFSIIFLIIALFAFLAALIFALVRIPVLWFLLIISPIAGEDRGMILSTPIPLLVIFLTVNILVSGVSPLILIRMPLKIWTLSLSPSLIL